MANMASLANGEAKLTRSNKSTTVFLSLPREVRQKILLYTHTSKIPPLRLPSLPKLDEYCPLVRKFAIGVRRSRITTMNNDRRRYFSQEYEWIFQWASLLKKIHARVEEDMDFIQKKWKDDVQRMFNDEERNSKEMMELLNNHSGFINSYLPSKR
jgi:hypothetical protein